MLGHRWGEINMDEYGWIWIGWFVLDAGWCGLSVVRIRIFRIMVDFQDWDDAGAVLGGLSSYVGSYLHRWGEACKRRVCIIHLGLLIL